jgi:hypothetical protein
MRLSIVTCALALAVPVRAQPVQDAPWSPLEGDGWPKGVSLEAVRGLPACGAGELDITEGAEIECRPATVVDAAHLAFGVDWTTGPAFGSERTSGGAHGLGVELAYAATRHLQLAARYELMGIGTSAMAVPRDRVGPHFFGLAKLRLFEDETAREAWTLGTGAGWALRPAGLGDDAPIARVSLARELGHYLDDDNSMNAAFELAYERTLDDDALSTILASYRLGFELDIREPRNVDTKAPPPSRRRWFGLDMFAGNAMALGVTQGLRITDVLGVQASAGFQFGSTEFSKQHGFEGGGWSVLAGPRLSLPSRWLAWYVQAQAGPVWLSRATGSELRGLGHAELGLRGLLGCGAVDVGIWARCDLEDRAVTSGGLLFRIVGGHPAASFRGPHPSCGRGQPTIARRPPPPPPPAPAEPPATVRYEPPPLPRVELPRVEVPRAEVVIEIEPVVIDVVLGAALPGFAVRVDPRLLPLDRLRGVAHVTVELSGPSGALGMYQAQLAGAIGRAGGQVHAWAVVPTGDPLVRARFTIRPR